MARADWRQRAAELRALTFDGALARLPAAVRRHAQLQTDAWEDETIDALITAANKLAQRTPCPLCGRSPQSEPDGYLVPEGLARHLRGWGALGQCRVMEVLCRHIHTQHFC